MRRLVAVAALLSVLLCLAWLRPLPVATEPSSVIGLQPGRTAVTWSGAEPYAISNFAGTPVTQIHRFDPVRQEWLSHFIGQHDPTLPDLHLLPRVQYLLASDAAYELAIPSPLADVDPLAALRMLAVPDDPLRFEAYWPNEDSPLEDLVVLRGEDERLSVKAWVEGGVGDVSVWWIIDGRVNHAGLESDDVDLVPGGHDHGRLYAVGALGEVAVVELPRVVRLPALELPEMVYGVMIFQAYTVMFSWFEDEGWKPYPGNWQAMEAALDLIVEAGFSAVGFGIPWLLVEPEPGYYAPEVLAELDRLIGEAVERGLSVMINHGSHPGWTMGAKHSIWAGQRPFAADRAPHPDNFAAFVGMLAQRWPQVTYWAPHNEPNMQWDFASMDPVALMEETKAAALAIYHANPQSVMIAPGMGFWSGEYSTWNCFGNTCGRIGWRTFLQAMYDHGLSEWVDVLDFHPYRCHLESGGPWTTPDDYQQRIDDFRAIMAQNGDADAPLWITENGWAGDAGRVDLETHAQCLADTLKLFGDRADVQAAFLWHFESHELASEVTSSDHFGIVAWDWAEGEFVPKPAWYAVREFLTGQPPPEE